MLTRLTFKATKFNTVRYSFVAEKDATDADRKKVAETFGNIGTITNLEEIMKSDSGLPTTILCTREDLHEIPMEFVYKSVEPRDIDVASLLKFDVNLANKMNFKCMNCYSKLFHKIYPKCKKYILTTQLKQYKEFSSMFADMQAERSLSVMYLRPFRDQTLYRDDKVKMNVITVNFEFECNSYWTFINNLNLQYVKLEDKENK